MVSCHIFIQLMGALKLFNYMPKSTSNSDGTMAFMRTISVILTEFEMGDKSPRTLT